MAGYLYKKSNRMLNTQSTMFRRRWFVLHDHMLYWYKNSIEVTAQCHHTHSPLSPQRPLTSTVSCCDCFTTLALHLSLI